eukprot:gene4998-34782_t
MIQQSRALVGLVRRAGLSGANASETWPQALAGLPAQPGFASEANLGSQPTKESTSSSSSNSIDATKMDSATLQNLASIVLSRSELFDAYLARKESDTAAMFQQLISQLDGSRKQMLMQKLAAVSGARAGPVLLAWLAAGIRSQLASWSPTDLQSQPFFHDLVAIAREIGSGHAAKDNVSELALVQWLLSPSSPGLPWHQLLAMNHLESMLQTVCENDEMLSKALGLLGLSDQQLEVLAPQSMLHEMKLAALSALATEKGVTWQEASKLEEVLSSSASDADGLSQTCMSALAELALLQYVGERLCVYQSAELLRMSHILGYAAPAPELPEASTMKAMLDKAVKQLLDSEALSASELSSMASAAFSTPVGSEQMSKLGVALLGSNGAAVEELLAFLLKQRHTAVMQGVPAAMISATKEDVAALSEEEFRSLRGRVRQFDAVGGMMEKNLFQQAGTHVDLAKLRVVSSDDKAALLWRLSSSPSGAEASRKLLEAFHSHVLKQHHQQDAVDKAYADLVMNFNLEADASLLDITSEPHETPEVLDHLPPSSLPPADELDALRKSLPDNELEVFDVLFSGGDVSETQVLVAFEALLQGWEGQEEPPASVVCGTELDVFGALFTGGDVTETQVLVAYEALLQGWEGQEETPASVVVPDNLRDWFNASKASINRLSPPMLTLMRRFLSLRVRSTASDAEEARLRSRALLAEVQTELRRVDRASSSSATSSSEGASMSPYWESLEGPDGTKLMVGGGQRLMLDPKLVKELLGEPESEQFIHWLQSSSLLTSDQPYDLLAAQHRAMDSSSLLTSDQPYDWLAAQHRAMDVDQYLQMQHDPRLHIELEQPPRPWLDPGNPMHAGEEAFLENMHEDFNSYLSATGLPPLLEVEWDVYKGHALAEFSVTRESNEMKLREEGHSGLFNSRADAFYLEQLLRQTVPPSSPLHEHGLKYLKVLEGNASWTFAQKKHIVVRLSELSAHFSKLNFDLERGSPFGGLFSAKGGSELIPKVSAGASQLHSAEAPKLPEGF